VTTGAVASAPAIPDEQVLAGICARAKDTATMERFGAQGERCGWCSQPVRLRGVQTTMDKTTGEILRRYSTASEPDGVLLKACGTRRATRCPSCAATYAADARMLVRSGISGGKGIPDSVSMHPMVFATLTAPSFGAVHRSLSGTAGSPASSTCHPRAQGRRCVHGRPLSCPTRHAAGDPLVGEPLCADCYDYESAVLWNATCPELWRRTTIYMRRELARLCGTTVKGLGEAVRLSFTKVAEYQRRGVVHLHAVVRIDAAGDGCAAPPGYIDTAVLTAAIEIAAAKVTAPFPGEAHGGSPGAARWGTQAHVRAIVEPTMHRGGEVGTPRGERQGSVSPGARAVANYVAKYATKSTDSGGALDRRLQSLSDLDARGVTGHLRRLVETAWELGERPGLAKLRHWAHTLGFGGHWLTKSRRYSVTFGSLRAERQAWQIRRQDKEAGDLSDTTVIADWEWAGTGWRTRGDAWLAAIAQKARERSRVDVREALCVEETAWHRGGGHLGGAGPLWSGQEPGVPAPADLLVIGEQAVPHAERWP